LEDAVSLGVPEEAAFSKAELRRCRDKLMAVHHPDHGGDAATAARVNETYRRMIEWLEQRDVRASAPTRPDGELAPEVIGPPAPSLTTKIRANFTKVAGAAIVAVAAVVALRGARKR
jgi:hypothetical protein